MGGKFSNLMDSPVQAQSNISADNNDHRQSKFAFTYHSGRSTCSRQNSNSRQYDRTDPDCRVIQTVEPNDYGIVNNSASFEEEEEDKQGGAPDRPCCREELKDTKRRSCSNPDLLSISANGSISSVAQPSSNSYVDPIIEEISSQPPPLPPRCSTERRSMRDKGVPRISPICKNGLKLSDTHYFVIPPPRKHIDSRGRSFNDEYHNVARKNSRPRYLSDSMADESIPSSSWQTQSPDLTTIDNPIYMSSENVLSNSHTNYIGQINQYGRSPKDKVPEQCVQKELIDSLCRLVPSATEQEVKVTLLGANWRLDEATKRLKEELLCRTGYACRSRVHYFLKENNWDLEAAVRQAKEEHEKWKPLYQE